MFTAVPQYGHAQSSFAAYITVAFSLTLFILKMEMPVVFADAPGRPLKSILTHRLVVNSRLDKSQYRSPFDTVSLSTSKRGVLTSSAMMS